MMELRKTPDEFMNWIKEYDNDRYDLTVTIYLKMIYVFYQT